MQRSTVADVMTTDVRWVPPEATFVEVADVLAGAAVRAVPVLDPDRRLLGVVSEADLLVTLERAADEPRRRWWRPRHVRRGPSAAKAGAATAAALMSAPAHTAAPGDSVAAAARAMREQGLSWLPVVDGDGRVVGVLGRSDLLAVFHRDDPAIRAEVVDEVFGRMLLVDPARVTVRVADGIVVLSGELETRADTELAVRFVERVEGVVSVVDLLRYRVDERLADAAVLPRY
ncbi:MAG: CBS domain-containing protein [Pseudonocardiales bacterium]|nr:CBS domain-containing protein [Pseudonocardiales bacterium]